MNFVFTEKIQLNNDPGAQTLFISDDVDTNTFCLFDLESKGACKRGRCYLSSGLFTCRTVKVRATEP